MTSERHVTLRAGGGPALRDAPRAPRPIPTTFATAEATPRQRRIALAFSAAMLALTLVLVPQATDRMPAIPGFLALNQGALLVVYGLTSWLLFSQFARA